MRTEACRSLPIVVAAGVLAALLWLMRDAQSIGELVLAAAQLGHVAQQHERADALPADDQRDRPELHHGAAGLDLGLPRRPAARHDHQGLVHRLVGVAQLGGDLAQVGADEVGLQAEPAVGGQRVRRGVGDPAGAVEELKAVLVDMRAVQSEGHPRTREVVGLLEDWTGQGG